MKRLTVLALVWASIAAATAQTDDARTIVDGLDQSQRQRFATLCVLFSAQSATARAAILAEAEIDAPTMARACQLVAANGSTNPAGGSPATGTAETFYPTSQRIQLSEPCPLIAKWISQGLAPGGHWQLLSYDKDLGILTFKIVDGALKNSDVRQYLEDPKAKHVRGDGIVFTLRSLVSSSLSFDGAPASSGESCAISTALKYVDKDGRSWASNGTGETEVLRRLEYRYKTHGLDY